MSGPDARPGRSCPTAYRYPPRTLDRAPGIEAETLLVVGGLYGNVFRFGPPLMIGSEDVREALQRFEAAFASCLDG